MGVAHLGVVESINFYANKSLYYGMTGIAVPELHERVGLVEGNRMISQLGAERDINQGTRLYLITRVVSVREVPGMDEIRKMRF